MIRIFYQALFITFFIVVADAWWTPWKSKDQKPKGTGWNKLSVTFPKYNDLPINAVDARKNGWHKINYCNVQSYFRGNRYILQNDKSVMLLFDSFGKIAGIQFGIAKSIAQHAGYNKSHWNADGDSFVVTAYFVHPSVICNGSRSNSSYIGENLYIQVGPSSKNLMKIPFKESDLASTKWVKGKCFYTMGQHYWYDISTNMKCENFFPVFLLYNSKKLTGFGWAMQGNVKSSRVEHPTPNRLHFFFEKKTRPLCLNKQGVLTTEHVFFKKNPVLSFC